MKKLIVVIALVMGLVASAFAANLADAAGNAVKEKLEGAISSKVSNLSDIAKLLPQGIGNTFKNLTTDFFGGLNGTIFNALNFASFGNLEKCYVPTETKSNLDACGWADALDELGKGDFCNLVPAMTGWTRKKDEDTKFDLQTSFGASCRAKQAEFGSPLANLADRTSSLGEDEKDSSSSKDSSKDCDKAAAEKELYDLFSFKNIQNMKDSYVYEAATTNDNKTLKLIREYYTSATNGFELCKGVTNVKTQLKDITEDMVYANATPKTAGEYQEQVNETVKETAKIRKGTNSIALVKEAGLIAKAKFANENFSNSTEVISKIESKIEEDLKGARVQIREQKIVESKKAIAKHRDETSALENPSDDFVQRLKPAYQKAARQTINKQMLDEIAIHDNVFEKYEKKEQLLDLLISKEAVYQWDFNPDDARESVKGYIKCANDSQTDDCKELLGWE